MKIIFIFVLTSCNSQTSQNHKFFTEIYHIPGVDTLSKIKIGGGHEILELNFRDNTYDIIRIVKDYKIIGQISLPIPDVEVKNLTVNKIEETKEGFMLSVDWGGGNNFYNRDFYFYFIENESSFYLKKITKKSYNPESKSETFDREDIIPLLKIDSVDLSIFIVNE